MDAGKLVDDATVLGMIRERLTRPDAAKGFILDGFSPQYPPAEALSKVLAEMGTPLQAVVLLNLDLGILFKRLAGAEAVESCGRGFQRLYQRRLRRWNMRQVRRGASAHSAPGRQGRSHRQEARCLRGADQAADQLTTGRPELLRVVDADAGVNAVFENIQKAIGAAP